jgi:SAM-dependent methyltransferase
VTSTEPVADPVIWHDVECSGYSADLALWRELAVRANGPILDIGCGTGRVALDLAARGFDVTGLDSEPALVDALAQRARERRLRVETVVADARSFELGREFALAIAPMQVVQLLGGQDAWLSMLRQVRAHLAPGGRFAAALADPFEGMSAEESEPPAPDVRERDGWVFQSTPIRVRGEEGATVIERLRQSVSPEGQLEEVVASIRLDEVCARGFESIASDAGFRVLAQRHVPPTEDYVGSVVVMLERGA